MKKKLFLYVTQHIDLVWRRCFERDFTYKGQNFVSYADLFEYYIIENINLCKKYPFYKFNIECVAVLKKFLKRRPEYEGIIKQLFEKKQVYVPFSGHNIIDVNLVGGESIIRNYLYGYKYLKNNYNHIPYGVDRLDAFGNSAQLPQIVKGFGSDWIFHVGYCDCDKDYWKGLDGSIVVQYNPETVGFAGGWYKYRPCPACNGFKDKDCDVCNNRRIDVDFTENFRNHICDPEVEKDDIPVRIQCGGEEILPSEESVLWALENSDKYDISFTSTDSYEPYIKAMAERIPSLTNDEIFGSCELNPCNTGCYVTRIKIKQNARKAENLILGAEAISVMSYISGNEYPYDKIEKIWDKILFTDFHDSITGTVIDAGYDEIMDAFKEIFTKTDEVKNETLKSIVQKDDCISLINPYGIDISANTSAEIESENDVTLVDGDGKEVSILDYERKGNTVKITFLAENVEAFGCKKYSVKKKEYKKVNTEIYKVNKISGKAVLTNESADLSRKKTEVHVIENEFFKVTAEESGITEIFDKKLNKSISKSSEYNVGEWILEHDEGSPWATLSEDMRRQKLGMYTTLTGIEETENTKKLVFYIVPQDLDGYSVLGLKIKYSVILQKNCNEVKFEADVFWHTQNYRLRIAFPAVGDGKYFYDIPYGVIERKPYKTNIVFDNGASNNSGAAGDYPAINWAGVQLADYSMILMNKGTPSYQVNADEKGNATIYLSPLRSPSIGAYLYSPSEYTMTDYDGMRDNGEHHFEYAIKAYENGFEENNAVLDGVQYNSELVSVKGNVMIPKMPVLTCDNARISSLKLACDRKGIVYRICEYKGKSSEGELILPDGFGTVYETDMKEENKKQIVGNKIKLRPFEIKTVYVEL